MQGAYRPPYDVDDAPDPLQAYGQQKRAGEIAVLSEREQAAKATVLRVPLLYGKTEYNEESAVNILVDGTSHISRSSQPNSSLSLPLASMSWRSW